MSSQEDYQESSDEEEHDDVFPPSLGAIHRNGGFNGSARLHSNAPSHLENLDDDDDDDDDVDVDAMMASPSVEEYERRIQRLEQTNAILRQNVAALYAENASSSMQTRERRVSRSTINKLTHMELSQDEAYATPIPDSDHLLVNEEHYLHTIRALQKTNAELHIKLHRQKMLVSHLSANLKVAAEKIQHLMHSRTDNDHSNASGPEAFTLDDKETKMRQCVATNDASVNEIQQYQIEVIQHEIQSILHLISRTSAEHNQNAAQLLEHYPNVDIHSAHTGATATWLDRETFTERLQRVIRQLRGEHISNIDDSSRSQRVVDAIYLDEDHLSTLGSDNNVSNSTNQRISEATNANTEKQAALHNTYFPSVEVDSATSTDRLRSAETGVQPSSQDDDDSIHLRQEVDQGGIIEERNCSTATDESFISGPLTQYQQGSFVVQHDTDDLGTKIEDHISRYLPSTVVKDECLFVNHDFKETNDNISSDIESQNETSCIVMETQLCEFDRGDNEVISLVEEPRCFGDPVAQESLDKTDDSYKSEHQVHNEALSNDDASKGSDSSMPLHSFERYAIASRSDDRVNDTSGKLTGDEGHKINCSSSSCLETQNLSVLVPELDTDNVGYGKSEFESCKSSLKTPPANKSDSSNHDSSENEIKSPTIFGYTLSDLVPSKNLSLETGDTPMQEASDTAPLLITANQEKKSVNSTSSNEDKLNCVEKNNPRSNIHGMTPNVLSGSNLQTWDDVMRRRRSAILRSTKLDAAHSSAMRLSRRQLFQQSKTSLSAGHTDSNGNKQHRSVLVIANNGIDYIPPSLPPTLPSLKNQDAPIFKKGLKDGFYNYKSSTGNEYSGNWKDGKRHGFGTAKYRDGEVYCGQWRSGRRHGVGTLHLANTEVFDGTWDSNMKHGIGTYFWADGDVDVSWYEQDVRLESIRWSKDRQSAYQLDLQSSKKNQIPLRHATQIVREWERRG